MQRSSQQHPINCSAMCIYDLRNVTMDRKVPPSRSARVARGESLSALNGALAPKSAKKENWALHFFRASRLAVTRILARGTSASSASDSSRFLIARPIRANLPGSSKCLRPLFPPPLYLSAFHHRKFLNRRCTRAHARARTLARSLLIPRGSAKSPPALLRMIDCARVTSRPVLGPFARSVYLSFFANAAVEGRRWSSRAIDFLNN